MTVRLQLLATVLLMGACGALGWGLKNELERVDRPPVDDRRTTAASGKEAMPSAGGPFSMARIDALSEIVRRPIFFEDRRLPEPEAPAPEAPPDVKPPGRVVLVGVIISPHERLALVRKPDSQEVLHVSIGQAIDAWKLEDIRPDRIVLSWEDKVEEVMIDDTVGAPPRAAPPRRNGVAPRRVPGRPPQRNGAPPRQERGAERH